MVEYEVMERAQLISANGTCVRGADSRLLGWFLKQDQIGNLTSAFCCLQMCSYKKLQKGMYVMISDSSWKPVVSKLFL